MAPKKSTNREDVAKGRGMTLIFKTSRKHTRKSNRTGVRAARRNRKRG